VGVCALAFAGVPHTFQDGETLKADALNANFGGLDQRLLALEAREPFAGTYPAVLGLGTGYPAGGGPGTDVGGVWFCGGPPVTLNIDSKPLVPGGPVTFSHAFGSILFTNAGALSMNLDFPKALCSPAGMCAQPVTFFLKSPKAQTVSIYNYVDDVGAIYVDGNRVATGAGAPGASVIPIPDGSFALSFLACSSAGSTEGATIAFAIYDQFLATSDLGLTVDYDRTFHRNNR
jgi:hypothetical protein